MTIGATDYARACEILRLAPSAATPVERAAHVPSWFGPEIAATEHARARLAAWIDAGRPEPSVVEIGSTLRYCGAPDTLALVRAALASGAIAPPAVWHVLHKVLVVALGRDARGLCFVAPPSDVERVVLIRDDVDDAEVVSIFKHETAHAFLLPRAPRDLTPAEQALASSPDVFKIAAQFGFMDAYETALVRDERQACALAARWGATGVSADSEWCAHGARRRVHREAAR